jgi:hypothetical protein
MIKQLTYTDFKEVSKQLKAPINEEFKNFYLYINQDPTKDSAYFDLKPLPKDGNRQDIDISFTSKCQDDKNKEIKGTYTITIATEIADEYGIPHMYVGRTKSQLIDHIRKIGSRDGRTLLS